MKQPFTHVITWIIGALVGFWWGSVRQQHSGLVRLTTASPVPPSVTSSVQPGKPLVGSAGTALDMLTHAAKLSGTKEATLFLYRALEEIRVDQLAAFAAELGQIPGNTPYVNVAVEEVFRRLAQWDLASARACLVGMNLANRWVATVAVFKAWAESDPKGALTAANDLSEEEERKAAQANVIEAWAELDPTAVVAWYGKLSRKQQETTHLGNLLQSLLRNDPQLAVAIVNTQSGDLRANGIRQLANIWGELDLTSAWQWTQGLALKEQAMAIGGLGTAARSADLATFVRVATQITNRSSRNEFLHNCFNGGNRCDPEKVQGILQQLDPSDVLDVMSHTGMLSGLALKNPAAAAALLTAQPLPPAHTAWASVAEAYGRKDPVAAYHWAVSHAEAVPMRQLASIIGQLGYKDGSSALDKAQALPEGLLRNNTVSAVMEAWGATDAAGLEHAAETMSDGMRTLALQQVLTGQSHDDPLAAASAVLQMQQSQDPAVVQAAINATSAIIFTWAASDPAAAALWVGQLPPGQQQSLGLESLASYWTREDPQSASKWIQQLPEGRDKDRAIRELVANISGSDPESAVIWAGNIHEAATRGTALSQALRALLKADPVAGKRALEAAPLSALEKQELMK